MKRIFAASSLLAVAALAACGGGGATSTIPAQTKPGSPGSTQSIAVRMTIGGPGGTTSSSGRSPKFVSASTNGVLAQVYSDSGYTTLVAQSAVDVSSGSAACGGATGYPRTCTVALPLGAGTYWLKIASYDAAPVGGSFASAHLLAQGTVAGFSVVANQANMLSVFLSGVISNIGVGNAAYISLPGDGNLHIVSLLVNPTDFGNNAIVAGANDPYANPITISLGETGGTGHATLILNGGPASSSVTLTKSSDSAVLSYDGKGAPGYGISLTFTASGAPTQTVAISPLYVSSVSPLFTSTLGAQALNFYAASQSATLSLTELGAPGTTTYTATANAGCSGIATPGSMSGSGASASVSVTNGATLSATGCVLTIADSLGTSTQLPVAVSNTGSGGSVTVPTAGLITEFSTGMSASAQPSGIAAGPDGNLWFTERSADNIGRITPAGVITEFPIPTASAKPSWIAGGSDGNLWFTEEGGNRIGRITPAGVITEFSSGISPSANPYGIAAGSDGNLWFTEEAGNRIGRITPAGVITEFSTGMSASSMPYGIAAGPDGNLWFTEYTGNRIGRITPAGVITEFSTGLTAGADPSGITAGPDGNLWFTECSGNRIGRITPAGVITEFSTGMSAGASPAGIVAGPDGNLWFAELNGNRIGRITPAGVITEFSTGMSAGAVPYGIAAGPDGNLWFGELAGNRIGRITP